MSVKLTPAKIFDFSLLCGFSVTEYIRKRRLTLAGQDVAATNEKIIDIALKYGYDSPDSFTKAFTRFHGATPISIRKDHLSVKSYSPLKIIFSLEGGYIMDYKIVKKDAFDIIGIGKKFSYETANEEIPIFRREFYTENKFPNLKGSFGINVDVEKGNFEYIIADRIDCNTRIENALIRKTVPSLTWAVFPCIGAIPHSLQNILKRVFSEWLPQTSNYEFAEGLLIEYYDDPSKYSNGILDEKYYCELWIPIKTK